RAYISINKFRGFTLAFGKERKNLTLNFLNSILNKDEDSYFVDINFLDKERLPDIETGKVPELDILAKLNDGTLINVEIQVTKQEYFSKRSLYYWSRLYAYQLNKGQNYDELKQTITINLLNFNYLPYETCHNSYHVYNDKTQDILIDDLELHFIELNKFKLSDVRKLRQAENWIAYFSPKCTDEQREAIAMNNPVIKEALNYEMVFYIIAKRD
uniref:Rpn family recombination-promoting nuclease/putative transposase n=1 Tax=uncultured Megamonas sp. TaxID=286140 RepID=UPI00259B509C